MKIRNTPIDDRPTVNDGLVAKYKTLRQKPAWIKTRSFFWAVGVVLWEDVVPALLALGEGSKNHKQFPIAGGGGAYDDEECIDDAPYGHHPVTGAPMRNINEDIHGNSL
jgi:hypothetical protein